MLRSCDVLWLLRGCLMGSSSSQLLVSTITYKLWCIWLDVLATTHLDSCEWESALSNVFRTTWIIIITAKSSAAIDCGQLSVKTITNIHLLLINTRTQCPLVIAYSQHGDLTSETQFYHTKIVNFTPSPWQVQIFIWIVNDIFWSLESVCIVGTHIMVVYIEIFSLISLLSDTTRAVSRDDMWPPKEVHFTWWAYDYQLRQSLLTSVGVIYKYCKLWTAVADSYSHQYECSETTSHHTESNISG